MIRSSILFLLGIFLLTGFALAQIPNPGFEDWTNGNPDGWFPNNIPPLYSTITQTSSAHSGSSALQGTVVSYFDTPISPLILSGTDGQGFPYTSHPGSFHGFYKMTTVGGDYLSGYAVFIKNGQFIGSAYINLGSAGSYTEFATDITWSTADNPDSAQIGLIVVNDNDTVHIGTIFYLDDLNFSNSVDVKQNGITPFKFELAQNYPNPFNPSTVISYSIPEQSFVSLKIYNLLGQEVASLVNEEKSAGNYKVDFSTSGAAGDNLASGIYIYRLTAGDLVQTKKMMLLK
ncbi:MAG TPA: T9SS type A sorting domain-containing protein [Ignavibacteriaceae bacterium]|nr:T9SS type A sorting domain-containing protein [Ignavibacteriaceae bacterium]